jgi:hypothetical protein
MKKRLLMLLASVSMVAALTACGGKEEPAEEVTVNFEEEAEAEVEEAVTETVVPVEVPEGFYRSELTNEVISEELKDQRPIAVMVDNDKRALPHFGLTQADVVYELMNSTHNKEVTRFMCLVKDWDAIEQFGSVRSLRPTNILLANEWNAIICHDGGPFYINDYLALPASDNISGYFGRVENGKPREFTEYILTGEVQKYADRLGIQTSYTEHYKGAHYQFADEANPVLLENVYADYAKEATFIDLPFPNNQSELKYNAEDGLYYYSEHGGPHLDAQNDNKQLAFKNVIIQRVSYNQLDENGYLIFNCIGENQQAMYITNGKQINVTWSKLSDTDPTRYYDGYGDEITINTGKTYVAFVADQRWEELIVK